MPDPSPSSGRPAASRSRARSPQLGDQAARPVASARPRRSSSTHSGEPGSAAERNEPRWRDIQWIDFTIDSKADQPIDPPAFPEAKPAPATTSAREDDSVAKTLRRFSQSARHGGRTNIPGLAPRFARLPVPRPRPGGIEPASVAPVAAMRAAPSPKLRPSEDEERFPASIHTPVGTRPEPSPPPQPGAELGPAPQPLAPRHRPRPARPPLASVLAGRVHAAALRLAGDDPERLRRWLTVVGTAIAVAVVAYAVGAMVAGLASLDTRRHSMSDQPAPSVQSVAAQPKPPPPAPQPPLTSPAGAPPTPTAPPSEPVARAADYLARAKTGDPVAQYDIGVLYAQGSGLVQDYASAASWFHAAAAQGNLDAEYNLGVFSERGLGVAASPIDAVNWYRSAADQNHAHAQYNLAIAYAEGRGTEQDLAAAARWYQRAAQQGVVPAMVNLASLYERGQGVERSLVDAYAWYSAAAERGDNPAKDRAGELLRQFTEQDRAKAQGLAATIAAAINGAPPA